MPKSPPPFCTTVCDLNLRSGAGTTFPIVTTLKPGTPLEILEDAGKWLRVRADKQEGFVSRTFVRMEEHHLPKGFLIHRGEALAWPFLPDNPVKVPGKTDAATRNVAAIWNRFGGLLEPLADAIGIDPAAAVAVVGVESGGSGFSGRRMVSRDERPQLIGLFDFIKGPHSVSPAVNALQNLDFSGFAARYNGTGQAAAYGTVLQQYYEAFTRLRG